MKSKVSHSLPWPLLVGAKFLQVHPLGTICAILLALPGQIALIASFLLPIKIIMLMASDGMPSFMPSIAENVDKKTLVSVLASLSIASFAFYHLTNKAIQAIAHSGAFRIEKRNQKLHLFEGQEELTRNSYTRYIDTVASINFIGLGLIALLLIYPEVALTCIIYILLCLMGAATTKKVKKTDFDAFASSIQKKLPTLTGIGFFLVFFLVLIDYVFFSIPESFITLLISVILARQLLTRTSAIINSTFFLTRQKQKLKALLFHREVLKPSIKSHNTIWDFLDSTTTSYQQLQGLLNSILESTSNDVKLTWKDSGLPGIGFMTAFHPKSGKTFLVKAFDTKKTAEARHEATLLLDPPKKLPSPSLCVDAIISGLTIHIMDITDYAFPLEKSIRKIKDEVALEISKASIPDVLLSRYIRSHRLLWDQLEDIKLQQLSILFKEEDAKQCVISKISKIQDELKRLPLRIYNPHLANANIYAQSPSGETQILHWGKWIIEPLGAGLTKTSIDKLTQADSDQNHARNIKQHPMIAPDPLIALLSRQLYNQIQQQLPLKALETLDELSSRFPYPLKDEGTIEN